MTLKIEVGKEYVMRGGEVVRCESIDSGESQYPAHMVAKSGARFDLTMEGRFLAHEGWGNLGLDIISEYHAAPTEPAPTDEPESLRDKFSMAALTGLLARSHVDPEIAAVRAFAYAKFMMEARKK